jgi:hypothetical protein
MKRAPLRIGALACQRGAYGLFGLVGEKGLPYGPNGFATLFGSLDYLLWYHLYEAASPGWWERTNRRMQKERGRVMTGYRPGGKIPWTPWGIGAATQTMPENH